MTQELYYERHTEFGKTFIHCWARTPWGVHILMWVREMGEAA